MCESRWGVECGVWFEYEKCGGGCRWCLGFGLCVVEKLPSLIIF